MVLVGSVAYGFIATLLLISILFIVLEDDLGPGTTFVGGVGVLAGSLSAIGVYLLFGPPSNPQRLVFWFLTGLVIVVGVAFLFYTLRRLLQ